MDVGLDKMKKEEDATSFEFVDTDIKTEIVKEELMEADNIIKCEKCKDNSSSETDCQHHKNYRLGELDKKLDVPGLGKADHLQKNSIEDVKPKVENEECSSVSQQRKDPISKLVTGEITVKQEVPFDTPEYVSVGNDFLNSQAQQIKIEKEDIFCEDVKIETIKEEPLDDEAGLSPDMMIQDEDSSEDAMPGPSGGSKKARKNRKRCIVPGCENTDSTTHKAFFALPRGKKERLVWQRVMGRTEFVSDKSTSYCCEDHFKLEDDTVNYLQHKMMGNVKLKLKPKVVPSKFACREKQLALKRSLPDVVKEAGTSAKKVRHQATQTERKLNTRDVGVQVDLGEEEDAIQPQKMAKKRSRKSKLTK